MNKHIGKFEIVLKYLLAAILISVALYPKFPFLRIPGTFVSVRLEDVLLGISFLLFGIYLIIRRQVKKLFLDKVTISILLYLIIGLISLLASVSITHTTALHIGTLHWLRRLEYFTPFFMAYYLVREDRSVIKYFFTIVVIIVFAVFLYGFGQKYFEWPIIITQNEEYSKGVALRYIAGGHINSTFAGHYDLASYLVLVLPVIISYFFLIKDRTQKIILFACYCGAMWLLVNSASRISLVSYLVSSSFSLLLIKKYKEILLLIVISVLFTFLSPNLLSRYQRIIDVTIEKISSITVSPVIAQELPIKKLIDTPTPTVTAVFEDRSTNIRLNVEWPRAIRAFIKNPLLGTGYSSITLATDNDYLRAVGETGILGFLAFTYIFFNLLLNYLKIFPLRAYSALEKAFVVGIIGSTVGILINAIFIDVFEASKFAINFWLFMGISQAISQVKNE